MVTMAFAMPIDTENKVAEGDEAVAPVADMDTAEYVLTALFSLGKIKKAAPIIMSDMVIKCTKLPECSPIFDRVVAARHKDGYEV